MRNALWKRLGLLLSGGWIIVASIVLTSADLRIARFLRYSAFEVCDYVNYYLCHCGNCWRDLMAVAAFVDRPLVNFALIALTPVLLAWICTIVAVRAYHLIVGSNG